MSETSPDDTNVSSAPMPTSPLPLGLARRRPVLSLPTRTATCAAMSPVGPSAGVSATTQIADYRAPPAPVVRPLPSIWQRPTLPVSLPLPRFAASDPELTPRPAPAPAQQYHLPLGSGLLTPLYDLAKFDSANSSVARSELEVASVVPSDI